MADYVKPTLVEHTTLHVGDAETFRTTINDNFTVDATNTTKINDSLNDLNSSLVPVAKSGLATDITTDEEHEFVTDAEKVQYNRKTYIDTENEQMYQNDVNITTTVQNIFQDITKPTKVSELTNDSGYISSTDGKYDNPIVIYSNNVTATFVGEGTGYKLDDTFVRKMYLPLSNTYHTCNESMIPSVVFSQDDSMGGNYAQVCESGTMTINGASQGVVYIWGKSGVSMPTVKAVYAVEQFDVE